jgi:hypothetical protein
MQGLISPEDQATALVRPQFEWKAALDTEGDAVTYHIQVSSRSDFTTLEIDKKGIKTTSYTSEKDLAGAGFFWKVRAADAIGFGAWSPAWGFLTDITPPESHVNALPAYTTSANFTSR